MNKLVKIVDNKYVQIEEYKNQNICFDTSEYSDSENYCTLRETFDPFEIFYENQELKKQLKEYKRLGFKHLNDKCNKLENQQRKFIHYLEDLIKQNETVVDVSKYGLPKNCSKLLIDFYKEILQKYKEIIGDDK